MQHVLSAFRDFFRLSLFLYSSSAFFVRPSEVLWAGEGLRALFTSNFLVSCLDIARATLQRAPTTRLAPQTTSGMSGGTQQARASVTTRILPQAARPTAGKESGEGVMEAQEKTAGLRVMGAALDQR
jgi:hypothetical protein